MCTSYYVCFIGESEFAIKNRGSHLTMWISWDISTSEDKKIHPVYERENEVQKRGNIDKNPFSILKYIVNTYCIIEFRAAKINLQNVKNYKNIMSHFVVLCFQILCVQYISYTSL